jgi:hypothetical protein
MRSYNEILTEIEEYKAEKLKEIKLQFNKRDIIQTLDKKFKFDQVHVLKNKSSSIPSILKDK